MKGINSFFVLLCSWFSLSISINYVQKHEEQDFIASFIDNYGFTINARDTHEYHSFILGKTRNSFKELEEHLAQNFSLHGRMAICGYQENAIPNYYTSIKHDVVADELALKTKAGWQPVTHNLFGFATGFVLKDVNLFNCANNEQLFKHNQPERIGLFDDRAEIFHKHAFGQGYRLLNHMRTLINKNIVRKRTHEVIRLLYEFWKILYMHDITDGAKTIMATQDILFSIHYAKYILESQLPLRNFFVGPDITYPIEILRCQSAESTHSAQEFVRRFVPELKTINGETTAYIFCSFVDGVGKSTLLGNIKNYTMHQDNIDRYTRVDNSSSQAAAVWQLAPGVVIADLPAQSSHFIIKPDGYVFVSIDTVSAINEEKRDEIFAYIKTNHEKLKHKFNVKKEQVKQLKIAQYSALKDPISSYISNLMILERSSSWIPFYFQDNYFLFNESNHTEIRILQPLEGVHSCGLKVAEPEQMIFSKGVSMPLNKRFFLEDLSSQLKEYAVKNIVFVDFMSMYPRTSRENIRVNFIMQQLKQQFGDLFSIEKSLYKGFMQSQELYLLLKKWRLEVARSIVQETALRFALFSLLQKSTHDKNTHVPLDVLAQQLKEELDMIFEKHKDQLLLHAKKKIMVEYEELLKTYCFDRDFEAITRFEFEPLLECSKLLHKLCTQKIHDAYLNEAWNNLDSIHSLDTDPLLPDENKRRFVLNDGSFVELLYTFNSECRDKYALKECLNCIRVHWYAAISNLFHVKNNSADFFTLDSPAYRVPALMVIQDSQGLIRVIRKKMPLFDGDLKNLKLEHTFFIQEEMKKKSKISWGMFLGEPCCINFKKVNVGVKLFGFGYKENKTQRKNVVSCIVDQFNFLHDPDKNNILFVPTSHLLKAINEQVLWHEIAQEFSAINRKAKKCSAEAARLAIRWLATVDMICKTVDAQIMVRKDNKDDFSAALELLEKITLPLYFNCRLSSGLFENYVAVEPVLSWQSFE